jgi:hypothetical protein
MTPFCDYLNVSVPYDESLTVLDECVRILNEQAADYVMQSQCGRFGTWRLGPARFGGTFKATRRGAVAVLSASGSLLAQLRAAQVHIAYLQALASVPHRVTLLHATLDMPDDAPAIVDRLYQRAVGGGVSLTRKAIKPSAVKRYWGPGADGRETGTVYVGNRKNADVWAKVYDKRQERLDRGCPDPGPMVRYEVCVHGDAGPSLRDAHDPTSLFYHFASPDLLERPPGVPAWVSGAVGLVLPPRVVRPAMDRLRALVGDHPAFATAAALAREIGPTGMAFLSELLSKKAAASSAG